VNLPRALFAEFLGSMLLAAVVIGSGIMAERLADGNSAVALLANTGATVVALAVLIATFALISGAHFNPAVTLVQALSRKLPPGPALAFVLSQLAGCIAGALLAHAMFELPLIQASTHVRTGFAQWLSEFVATAGLVLVVLTSANAHQASWRVPAWIGAAYWFTASTSFANPAISVARSLTDTFSGIRPEDLPGFVIAQLLGALAGLLIARTLKHQTLKV
jgi:glycerol uptake facilitator-like aquaporin